MSERLQMQGMLNLMEQDAKNIKMKIEAGCRTIRETLNTTLTEVEDLDVAMAANQMDDLVMHHADLLRVQGKIARLKKELGRG